MEMTLLLQAGAGLLIVLGLIALAAFAARKLGYGAVGGRPDKRLSIIETMALDPKRRVMLIRCDEAEHLLLLGAAGETVLARIGPGQAQQGTSREPAAATTNLSMFSRTPRREPRSES